MRTEIDQGIVLKKFSPEDAQAVFARVDSNREHLRQWLPWVDATRTVEDSMGFIEMTMKNFDANQSLQCGIWVDGEFAGAVGHHRILWQNRWTSLGYWLAKGFEGRGIMTKAVSWFVNHSFKDLKLNCVVVEAAVENAKSRAIPERLGLKQEGVLRQREWLYDHFVDHAVYSVLAREWKRG